MVSTYFFIELALEKPITLVVKYFVQKVIKIHNCRLSNSYQNYIPTLKFDQFLTQAENLIAYLKK
jgi:hypothetical protein